MPVLGYSGVGAGMVTSVNGGSGAVTITPESISAIADRSDITGLTGGTSTDLDSIVTTGITVPYIIGIYRGNNTEFWTLVSGTDAEDAVNGIVRPDDYATTTNEKVWYATLWS